ncbi:MAG: sugar phosphate isomerase/epimerase [Chloroflexi bacterium]|nr:sugar phosphate isomerase/epimerase [Chloroflexota bacterium]
MRLAGHTMGTPEYSLVEALHLFAQLGLEGAEIICQEDYRCGLSPRASREEAVALGQQARELGVRPVALTPYIWAINALDPQERAAALAELNGVIRLAGALGACFVRVYAGSFPPGSDRWQERWEVLVASLRQLAHLAEEEGVVLAVENHFNTMTPSAALTVRLVEEVGSPAVGILYDQANLSFQGDEDYPEAIALQAGRIVLVHVKDFVPLEAGGAFQASQVFVVREEERRVRSRVVGEGCLPWPAILQRLVASGYRGWLSLEYERRWHPQDLPPAPEGLRRSAEYLRQVLRMLVPAEG